jgi:hypothetical protein
VASVLQFATKSDGRFDIATRSIARQDKFHRGPSLSVVMYVGNLSNIMSGLSAIG